MTCVVYDVIYLIIVIIHAHVDMFVVHNKQLKATYETLELTKNR